MNPRFIDTHCHVHFNAYKDDMDEVIKRTLEKGVFMITVGTQSTTSKNGFDIAEKYEGVWTTVGLHPNHTVEQEFWDDDELPPEEQATPKIKTRAEVFDMEYYRALAMHPKCVAIGECGLDYYRIPEKVDREVVKQRQEEAVRAQFALAQELNLPVVIHCRDAHTDQQKIIKEFPGLRGVVHCFTGTIEEAHAYIDLDFLISITGIVTFAKDLQETVAQIPLESLMIETDAPYLTPVPNRGKRNEPWMVEFVAEKIAELKNTTVDDVARMTTQNAKNLFRIHHV